MECLLFSGHTQRIQRLICTADFIISSSTDKTCMLWRLTDAIQDSKDRERTEEDPIDERWIRTFRVTFLGGKQKKDLSFVALFVRLQS